MSRLLINEPPLQVLPSLAVAIGLNEAMLLQQLHYWLQRSNIEHDGRQWVYNTMEDWQKQLPFWSVATIKRAFNGLRELGIIDNEQLSADKRDKTNYYTINYGALDELPMRSICTYGEGQIDTIQEINLSRSYIRTETTTETTTEKKNTAPIGAPAKDKTKTVSKPEEVEQQVWLDFCQQRKTQKAPITQTALDGIAREAAKAGLSLNDAIRICLERGWRGFRAEWMQEKQFGQKPQGGTVNGIGVSATTVGNVQAMQEYFAKKGEVFHAEIGTKNSQAPNEKNHDVIDV